MIDWNNNGRIDPVDIGVSIAVSQENEPEAHSVGKEKEPSVFDLLKSLFRRKQS